LFFSLLPAAAQHTSEPLPPSCSRCRRWWVVGRKRPGLYQGKENASLAHDDGGGVGCGWGCAFCRAKANQESDRAEGHSTEGRLPGFTTAAMNGQERLEKLKAQVRIGGKVSASLWLFASCSRRKLPPPGPEALLLSRSPALAPTLCVCAPLCPWRRW
jgi:hypothetical protein